MKKVESGTGASDFGAIERQARAYLNAAGDHSQDLPQEGTSHTFTSVSVVLPAITKADVAELIYAEWAGASEKHFPWWIQSAADKIMERINSQ